MKNKTAAILTIAAMVLSGAAIADAKTHGHWTDVGTRVTKVTRYLASYDDRIVEYKWLKIPMHMLASTCHIKDNAGSCRISECARWLRSEVYTAPDGVTTTYQVPKFIETTTDHVRLRNDHVQVNDWGGTVHAPPLTLIMSGASGPKVRSCTAG